MAFAKNEIDLSKLVGDTGATKRDHLESLRGMIDIPEIDEAPQLPETAAYLWYWYIDLVNSSTISYNEIKAWSDLMNINIKSWEVSAIMRIEQLRNSLK